MSFDFGALPPEIISGWMYAGAGAGPLMTAASAWSSLAAELESAAAASQAVIAELADGQWSGPAATAMNTAVTPYLNWLNSTAATAQQAGLQAMASAAAFQTAYGMTVPPPVIAANRVQLAALVASNILGQNTPAILATEAHYMQMWVQDSIAMTGYSTSAASAGQLTPMSAAPQVATPTLAAQSVAATGGLDDQLGQLVTGLQQALQWLASPVVASEASPMATMIDQFLGTPLFANAINGAVNTGAWFTFAAIPNAVSLAHTLAANAPAAVAAEAVGAGALGIGAGLTGAPVGAVALGGAPVLAGMAQSAPVGGLSVPATWSAATPASGATTLAGSGWTAAADAETSMSAVPAGMGAVGAGGRGGLGLGAPRYGFKPTVMPKQVIV